MAMRTGIAPIRNKSGLTKSWWYYLIHNTEDALRLGLYCQTLARVMLMRTRRLLLVSLHLGLGAGTSSFRVTKLSNPAWQQLNE